MCPAPARLRAHSATSVSTVFFLLKGRIIGLEGKAEVFHLLARSPNGRPWVGARSSIRVSHMRGWQGPKELGHHLLPSHLRKQSFGRGAAKTHSKQHAEMGRWCHEWQLN